jgi:hypothetical protein
VALATTGAAEYTELEVLPYVEIIGMRDPQTGPTTTASRDRNVEPGVFVEEPTYWCERDYLGARIKLDWESAAADHPDAWKQLGHDGPAAYRDIRVGHIDTGYTEHPARLDDPWRHLAEARPGQELREGKAGDAGARRRTAACVQ